MSASVGRRHCRSSFPTLTPTSADDTRRHSPTLRPTSADDTRRHWPTLRPTSADDVGVSVGKLDRQCRRPTLADTQADTQSVTLVIQIQNGGLGRQPRLRDALFGTSPCPAFTIGTWRYIANYTICPITPQLPSRLIVNVTKQAIQTQNGGLWH